MEAALIAAVYKKFEYYRLNISTFHLIKFLVKQMPLAVQYGVRLAVAGPVQPPRRGGAAAGAGRAAAGVQVELSTKWCKAVNKIVLTNFIFGAFSEFCDNFR